MTDVVVDTLRLRGPGAHRLARVAARALPAALDRALADVADQRVPRIEVTLDLDPEEYDDETLAVLWADRIRAELVARPARRAATPAAGTGAAVPGPGQDVPGDDVVAAARAWLTAAPAADAPVPAALLGIGDPETAARAAAVLGPTEWSRLARALAVALRPAAARSVEEHGGGTGERAAGWAPEPRDAPRPAGPEQRGPGEVRAPTGADGEHARLTPGPPPPSADRAAAPGDVLGLLQVLAELRAGSPDPLEPATVSRCAGLVLLYPWLAEHCRRAEDLHPGLDPVPVREAALAAVVGDPDHADDPLVGLLAGRADPFHREPVVRAALARDAEVTESAERVLASFATLLPGFERSTPRFVRDGWLLRLGVLDADRDPVLLTAATQPLDVVLPLLPYPLGLLRLPWSPPLSVRFRP